MERTPSASAVTEVSRAWASLTPWDSSQVASLKYSSLGAAITPVAHQVHSSAALISDTMGRAGFKQHFPAEPAD